MEKAAGELAAKHYPDTLKSWKSNPLCEREMQNAALLLQFLKHARKLCIKLTFHTKKLVIKNGYFAGFARAPHQQTKLRDFFANNEKKKHSLLQLTQQNIISK